MSVCLSQFLRAVLPSPPEVDLLVLANVAFNSREPCLHTLSSAPAAHKHATSFPGPARSAWLLWHLCRVGTFAFGSVLR